MTEGGHPSERILVLSSSDREACLATRHLEAAGLSASVCRDVEDLCRQIEGGAGAALLVEEQLTDTTKTRLEKVLARQPTWSDFPLLVVATRKRGAHVRDEPIDCLGNVTLLDPPLRIRTMIRAARAALRGRRRQYAAARSIMERDRFLAMLGHELRNPLAAISLATELAARGEPPRVPVLRRQVDHLTRLVDDLLDVARVTSGRIKLDAQPMRLDLLLHDVASSMRERFGEAGVDLSVEGSGEPLVCGDPVRLEQVIANILTNAAKYTFEGGQVRARAWRDATHAHLSVADDGAGIAADMLPRVFEPFVQGEVTIDRAQGGMGVGLALVRTLVELHGGTVQARSEGLGQGSEFCVSLPLSASKAIGDVSRARQANGENGAGGSRTVLVVEDNTDARELLALALHHAGHTVVEAIDGEEALHLIRQRSVDAAVVDIGLPRVDGFEIARRVRRSLGEGVFLIALTGYGQPEDRRRALDAGFDVHLTKPADFTTLCALLEHRERTPNERLV